METSNSSSKTRGAVAPRTRITCTSFLGLEEPSLKLLRSSELQRTNSSPNSNSLLPNQHVAVDEAMILFKGRSTLKQYMPMKPTKQGYKAWCLCDSVNGYMYNIDIYTGKVSIGLTTNSDDGLATRVVKSITEPLYGKGHHIYMDKFFSSVALANVLKTKNTYTIGTARVGYKGWPLQLKTTKALNKSLNRGAHKSVSLECGVQCLVWKDKKTVAFINTISNPNSEAQVSRRNKDGSRSQIPCPQSVKLYNTYMGGVDLFDSRKKKLLL